LNGFRLVNEAPPEGGEWGLGIAPGREGEPGEAGAKEPETDAQADAEPGDGFGGRRGDGAFADLEAVDAEGDFEFEGVVGVGLLGVLFQALAQATDLDADGGIRFGVEFLRAAKHFGGEFIFADFAVLVIPEEDEQVAEDGSFAEEGMAGYAIKAWVAEWVAHFTNSSKIR
jgi:hypothetical protein